MTTFDVSGLPDVPRDTLRTLADSVGDFLLVGMAAVDLVTRGLADLPASRLTRDVDIAIAVATADAFRRRTRRLVPRGEAGGVHFWLGAGQVDVVPFGGLATDDHVTLADQRLDVSGLADAARTALELRVDPSLVVRVASLPALVVLKLIAWTDRGVETGDKDAYDVGLLLRAATSGRFADDVWADDDALARTDYDPERAGAFRVGRHIREQFSRPVVTRLVEVLTGPAGQRLRDLLSGRDSLATDRFDGLLLGIQAPDSGAVGQND